MRIWDLYEKTYEKLWVQYVSLRPTRQAVIEALSNLQVPEKTLLDMSCGTGQLLDDFRSRCPELKTVGVEPSLMRRTAISKGHEIIDSDMETFSSDKQYGCIVCTHAFPYYLDQEASISKFYAHIKPEGYLILAHAETKTLYDRLMLGFVKLTTSKAKYPTPSEMETYLKPYFRICEVVGINAWYVPSITLYVTQKR